MCPPPGGLPDSEIEPRSSTLQADSLSSESPGKPFRAPCLSSTQPGLRRDAGGGVKPRAPYRTSRLRDQQPARDQNAVWVRKGHVEAEEGVGTDGADERRAWVESGPGFVPRSNLKAAQDSTGEKIRGEKPPLPPLPMPRPKLDVGKTSLEPGTSPLSGINSTPPPRSFFLCLPFCLTRA